MDKPRLSVVIVGWYSWEFLPACLDSIFQQNLSGLEVILVDNDSGDGTPLKVSQQYPQVKLIVNSINSGYTKACNQGLREAEGEFVWLFNPDTILQTDALTKMLEFMKGNPEVGALGPQLLNWDKSIQPSCRRFPDYATLLWEFTGLSRLFPSHPRFGSWRMGDFDFKSRREVDQPMASALLIRKKAIETVGLMDERFKMFFSDVDFCYRIQKARFKIVYYPEAKIVHYGGGSTEKRKSAMILNSHCGFFQFLKKYHSSGIGTILLPIFSLGLFFSAIVRMLYRVFIPQKRKL